MAKRATREAVLAWMHHTGSGARAAHTHFRIPLGTIKSWRRWAKQNDWTPPADPPPPSVDPPQHPGVDPPADPPQEQAPAPSPTPSRSRRSRRPPQPPPPSVDPPSSPGSPPSRKSARPRVGRTVLEAEDLDGETARLLRKGAMRLLRYISGELHEETAELETLTDEQRAALEAAGLARSVERLLDRGGWDPKGAKEASIALGVLVDKCPTILSLSELTTQSREAGADTGDKADAVAAALGLEEDEEEAGEA